MKGENALDILSVNSGSSSLKFAFYNMGEHEKLLFSGAFSGISLPEGNLHIKDSNGQTIINQKLTRFGHQDCITKLFDGLKGQGYLEKIEVIGHRIVHGGVKYTQPCLITSDLVNDLDELVLFAPEHLPQQLKVIEAIIKDYPNLKQVACFDTAFHRTMPKIAQMYALPRWVYEEGGIRYGFHGLSYEYIVEELKNENDIDLENKKIIIAHLGNGASMAAIKGGRSIDTTMGFSPAGGLMMSTRSGDLDPGILLYLFNEKNLNSLQVNKIINHQSGLLGVSEISSDMRELLAKESENTDAAEAVDLFCLQAKKHLGAFAGLLGGIDMLVFTGGIGENSAPIRERICRNMEFLGIHMDINLNNTNSFVISADDSPVVVRVMKTNEELMIARHTRKCVQS